MRSLIYAAVAFGFSSAFAVAQSLPEVNDGPGPNMVIDIASADGAPKGTIVLDLFPEAAPKHVERLVTLAKEGQYDGVVFHRVIDGFMAQSGDVQYGKTGGDTRLAGSGGSDLPDLPAEFSNLPFQPGTVGMARSSNPDSANSQFFINFDRTPHLDGQYTVVGQLVDGWDVLNSVKKGDSAANGAVQGPDYMAKVTIAE